MTELRELTRVFNKSNGPSKELGIDIGIALIFPY